MTPRPNYFKFLPLSSPVIARAWMAGLVFLVVFSSHGASSSAQYSIALDTLDSAGGRSQSALYTVDSSSGQSGGLSTASSPSLNLRSGYAGQLNDTPISVAESYSLARDTTLNIAAPGVLLNDFDYDDDPLTASVDVGPAHGTLNLLPNGSFSYTPTTGFSGTDQFSYRANDGLQLGSTTVVTLRVDAVNRAPSASSDALIAAEDTTLSLTSPGVLSNDNDPDGDTLSALLVTPPSHGTLTLNPDGSLAYTPSAHFNGTDSFTYRVTDGQVPSAPASVSITVNPVNDAPSALPDVFATSRDVSLNAPAPGVLVNDTDIENQPLTATVVTAPSHGTLILAPNGSFTYTPSSGFAGVDSFTYKVSDGSLDSSAVSVTINVTAVNRPPVANSDTFSISEDQALSISTPGVLSNDADPDGDPITALLATGPSHGTLSLALNGSFLYTPAANFNGSDSFTYQASDGVTASAPVVVRIDVNAVNDAPSATPASVVTPEDTPVAFTLAGTDPENNSLSFQVLVAPSKGTLSGTIPALTYTPAAHFNGSDSFSFKVTDGSADSVPATISITVSPVNDPPVSFDNAYSTATDTSLVVAAPGVLANDTDIESSTLTAVLASAPSHGLLTLNVNGGFTYTPASGYTGPDAFTYKASDGSLESSTSTVTLSVGLANRPPSSGGDTYSTTEDQALSIVIPGVLANDLDPDGDTLTALLITPPTHGTLSLRTDGSFLYTPSGNYFGPDSFTYQSTDGSLQSAATTVSINISAVNDPPTAAAQSLSLNEDSALAITLTGSDPESAPLIFSIVSTPAKGTLSGSPPALTYTPNANASGSDTFTFRVSDGVIESAPATISLSILEINDSPVATDDNYSSATGTVLSLSAPGVLGNDSDIEGQPLTASVVTPPASGSLSLISDGSFVYTPAAGFSGVVTFTYVASDGVANSTAATVTINVGGANRPPSAVADSVVAVEDQTLSVSVPGVLANDSDPDGNSMSAILVLPPSHGTLVLNGAGSFQYTPAPNYAGLDEFSYRATDGLLLSAPVNVSITVTPVNDPPSALVDLYNLLRNTVLTAPGPGVLANDSDVEGSTLTATLVSGPANGSLSLSLDGGFTYNPAPGFSGIDSFVYLAQDGLASSTPTTVTLQVNAGNLPPVATVNNYTVNEDQVLVVPAAGVLSNDSDPEGAPITAILVSTTSSGVLSLSPNGSFTYTPATHFFGTDSFTYQARDSSLSSDPVVVRIDVIAVNDAPLANSGSATVVEDTPTTIVLSGSDIESAALGFTVLMPPTRGTLSGVPPGLTYAPALNYSGPDSFTFKVSDGSADSAPATFSITVVPANDPPTAQPDSYLTSRDVTFTVSSPGVLANDLDLEGQPLTAVPVTSPSHGTLTLTPGGGFTYTPTPGYAGPDSFTYRASDGAAESAPAVVTLTVTASNRPPLGNVDNYFPLEDQVFSLPLPGILSNDIDVDGDPILAVLDSPPSHGTLILDPAGSFRYTPHPHYAGPDPFTYRVSDGLSQSSPILVNLNVIQVNDPPLAIPQAVSTPEDTPLAIILSGADIERNPLLFVVDSPPVNGVLSGTPPNLTYTPKPNFTGSDAFTFHAFDGSADSPPVAVSILVIASNDPPIAIPQSLSTPENTPLTVTLAGTDSDGDSLFITVTSPPANGTLTGSPPTVRYSPRSGFSGSDFFEFKVHDGKVESSAARVVITVIPVNSPPTLGDVPSQSTPEDSPMEFLVKVTDRESIPSQLHLIGRSLNPELFQDSGIVVEGSDETRKVRVSPVKDRNGTGKIELILTDPAGATAKLEVQIVVSPVNDPPVASTIRVIVIEDKSVPIALAASDIDSPSVRYEVFTAPGHGRLTGEGPLLQYFPNPDYQGVDRFSFRASDGEASSAPGEVEIVVLGTADPPSIDRIPTQTTEEDTPLTLTVRVRDPDGLDGIQVFLDTSNRLLLPLSNIKLEGSGEERTLTLTPAPEQHGATRVSLLVIDADSLQHTESFELIVRESNDAPLISPIPPQVMAEDSEHVVEGLIILDAESPPESLHVEFVSSDPELIGPDGFQIERIGIFARLKLKPKPNRNGVSRIIVTVKDPPGQSGQESFDLRVLPVNDPPIAEDRRATTGDGIPGLFSLKGSDPDGDPLQYFVLSTPLHGRVEGTPPRLTYIPDSGFTGEDSMSYLVSDGLLRSSPARITFKVLPRNQMRRFSSIVKGPSQGSPIVLQFFAVSGKQYFLEVTDNLNNGTWIVLKTFLAEEGGESVFNDDSAEFPRARFYRIREE